MNLGQPVTATDRTTGVRYDATATKDLINGGLQEIAKTRDWGWLEATHTFTTTGATSYALPAGWAKIRSLKVDDRPLPMVSIEFGDAQPSSDGWTIHADTLMLFPTSQTGGLVTVRYYKNEPELTADGDTPLLPVEWHNALVNYAAGEILARVAEGDKSAMARADRFDASYQSDLRRMVSQANRAKGPHRVRCVRPGSML